MKNIILSLCLLLILVACKEAKTDGTIEIDSNQQTDYFDLADFYRDTDYIGLTFPDSVNLTSIRSSKIKNDKLYVHDLRQNHILVFDLKNELYLYTISQRGEGPEEYQLINDFDVDDEGILYIYDFGRKVIAFKDGKFLQEWNDLKLHVRGFQKTKNGFLLMSPESSYELIRKPIVEIDEKGKVLNSMGGEVDNKLTVPIKYFQRVANSIYVNDMMNNQIVAFNTETDSIERTNFFIKDSSTFEIIDFWQVTPEEYFLMVAYRKGEEDKGIISYIKENAFISNYSAFTCSLDLLTMSSFPTNDDKGEYDYSLMTEEYFPAFASYLEKATEEGGSLTLKDGQYIFADYAIEQEKFDSNRAKIQDILGSNKILMRKYLRK